MTEEVKQDVVEKTLEPMEEQAREQGWVSKDEWEASGRDAGDHRSAKEFVERGELYKSIHSTKRELAQTKATLDSLAQHHTYLYEKGYQDAVKKMEQEKRAAIRAGEHEVAAEIDEDLDKLKETHQRERQALAQQQAAAIAFNNMPPELEAWNVRNSWYSTDIELKEYADAAGRVYMRKGGTKDGLLAHVEKKVREQFPERFGMTKKDPVKTTPGAVAGVDRTSSNKSNQVADDFVLTELQNKIMNDLVRGGVMTKEAYIKELKETEAKGTSR